MCPQSMRCRLAVPGYYRLAAQRSERDNADPNGKVSLCCQATWRWPTWERKEDMYCIEEEATACWNNIAMFSKQIRTNPSGP